MKAARELNGVTLDYRLQIYYITRSKFIIDFELLLRDETLRNKMKDEKESSQKTDKNKQVGKIDPARQASKN